MNKIKILDKEYDVWFDEFGLARINGMLIDEFLDQCTDEQLAYLEKHGKEIAVKEPEHFADIVDRHEITLLEPFVDPKYRSKSDDNAS